MLFGSLGIPRSLVFHESTVYSCAPLLGSRWIAVFVPLRRRRGPVCFSGSGLSLNLQMVLAPRYLRVASRRGAASVGIRRCAILLAGL